jgi:hypothetical protein
MPTPTVAGASDPVAAHGGVHHAKVDVPSPNGSPTKNEPLSCPPAAARNDGPRLPESPFDLLDEATCDFYLRSLRLLDESGVPYLVGGAYSLAYHAKIIRHTKDLDVFVRAADRDAVLEMFARNGYRAELTFPHWLGKAFDPRDETTFVDVIYGSGNGLCPVDDDWFAHATSGEVLGRPAKLVPVEEVIWTKAFLHERERYDGGDVNHMLQASGSTLNWRRLLGRFVGHERILLSHLMLFGYVYPAERDKVPGWVLDELFRTARAEPTPAGDKVCRGTFISREQYLVDVHQRGYADARLGPNGSMRAEDVKHWTDAIGTIR